MSFWFCGWFFFFGSQRELQLNHRHLVEQEELGVSLARMVLGLMAAGVGVMVVQVAIGAGVQVARAARVAKVAALVPRAMFIPIPTAIVVPMVGGGVGVGAWGGGGGGGGGWEKIDAVSGGN
jgi:hypothetical protein